MGCGCKNKGTPAPPPNTTPQQQQPKITNESVQEAIKKTIEKYYTVNKQK